MSLEIEGQRVSVPADQQDHRSYKPEKDIRPFDAFLSSNRLLKGLSSLGINLVQPGQLKVFRSIKIDDFINLIEETEPNNSNNADEQKTTDTSSRIISHITRDISTGIPRSALLDPSSNSELILENSSKWTAHSFSILVADMDFGGQPFRLVMCKEPKEQFPYELSLVMLTKIPKDQEVSLDLLPLNFRSVGFSYDFLRNPNHRERISEFYERRVNMDMVSGDPSKKSAIIGRQTPNGINAVSRLHLQIPNPFRHLKCYEVELFGLGVGQGRKRFLDNTEEIVPESHWQEEERHYCMTGDKETLTYPLFPIKELGQISTLSMAIAFDGNEYNQSVHSLLQGLPLTIDGTNRWYATGYLGDGYSAGNVELLLKPEWGEDNTKLVYRQKAKKRISPKEIRNAVTNTIALKDALKERLSEK